MNLLLLTFLITWACLMSSMSCHVPIVINTWPFTNATQSAWEVLSSGGTALDAIEMGCSRAERDQADGSVGWGNHPDENGEVTLDAMIMDGETHNVGAVGSLRRIKDAISVARHVLDHTSHTLLVGSQATQFAKMMGFSEENISSNKSQEDFNKWKSSGCQPNYWINVSPNPKTSCGPYSPITSSCTETTPSISEQNHDTIGMISIDAEGKIACGTSTNGLIHKIAGRVGDSPIPGAGSYVDREVGGAACTGDGDVMMRLLPAYQAVEFMIQGMSPMEAANGAMRRIVNKIPSFQGGIVTLSISGEVGAACVGLPDGFPYSVASISKPDPTVYHVKCI